MGVSSGATSVRALPVTGVFARMIEGAGWFREALTDREIRPRIPGRRSPEKDVQYDKRRSRRRNRIEIKEGRPKDWRRIAIRYDRCVKTFFAVVTPAATDLFWR